MIAFLNGFVNTWGVCLVRYKAICRSGIVLDCPLSDPSRRRGRLARDDKRGWAFETISRDTHTHMSSRRSGGIAAEPQTPRQGIGDEVIFACRQIWNRYDGLKAGEWYSPLPKKRHAGGAPDMLMPARPDDPYFPLKKHAQKSLCFNPRFLYLI